MKASAGWMVMGLGSMAATYSPIMTDPNPASGHLLAGFAVFLLVSVGGRAIHFGITGR
jgi:hypothetical protein